MKTRYGPNGIHMFDRQSGLNVLMDEVIVPEERWSLAPRYISIALTNACELECAYCYASKEPARLSDKKIIEWANHLDGAGCFGVGLGGGEPTLFPGFAPLCRELHQSTNLAITMTTHGHRFTSALVAQLSGNIDFIRLSMDGVGATYERLRGRAFVAFREKLAMVRDTARFGINYVVNEDTIVDLERAAEFAFENGSDELLLLPEIGRDGNVSLRLETIARLSKWVEENYTRCRLATSVHGGGIIDAPILPISNQRYQSFEFMHVDAFGTLKLSAFAGHGIVLANSSTIIEAVCLVRLNGKLATIEGEIQ